MLPILAVIGGAPLQSALDPVVALVAIDADGGIDPFCTATTLSPTWVLTAAHCARTAEERALLGDTTSIVWTADVAADASVSRGWTQVEVHPDWDGVAWDADLALLRIDGDAPGGSPILGTQAPEVGASLQFFGFGVDAELGGGDGVKRSTTLEVLDVSDTLVVSYAEGTNVCSGDSGGPVMGDGSEGPVLVALTTFVDPTCLGGAGGATRLDTRTDWIEEFVDDLRTTDVGRVRTQATEGCSHVSGGGRWGWVGVALGGVGLRRGGLRGKKGARPT